MLVNASPMDPSLDYTYGGSYHISSDPEAIVRFSFHGTAVYLLAPDLGLNWLYKNSTIVTIDGVQVENDISDASSCSMSYDGPRSAVVWEKRGLSDGEHTLVMGFNQGMDHLALDRVIYTTSDIPSNADFIGNSRASSPPHSPSQRSLNISGIVSRSFGSSSKKRTIIVTVAVIVALATILVALLTAAVLIRTNRRKAALRTQLMRKSILSGNSPSPYIQSFKGIDHSNEVGHRPYSSLDKAVTLTVPPGLGRSVRDEPVNTVWNSSEYALDRMIKVEEPEQEGSLAQTSPSKVLPNPWKNSMKSYAGPAGNISNASLSSIAAPEPVRTRSPRPLPPRPQDTSTSGTSPYPPSATRPKEVYSRPIVSFQGKEEVLRKKATQRTLIIHNE